MFVFVCVCVCVCVGADRFDNLSSADTHARAYYVVNYFPQPEMYLYSEWSGIETAENKYCDHIVNAFDRHHHFKLNLDLFQFVNFHE